MSDVVVTTPGKVQAAEAMPQAPAPPWPVRLWGRLVSFAFPGKVRPCVWEEFYLECLREEPQGEPIYSISGRGEFFGKDGREVMDAFFDHTSRRNWYAVLVDNHGEWEIPADVQKRADEARNEGWAGQAKVAVTKTKIASHFAICGSRVFIEAPHSPRATRENRPGSCITGDRLMMRAVRRAFNRIAQTAILGSIKTV